MIGIMFSELLRLPQVERHYQPDQHLFHRDDRVKFMFLIMAGSVHLVRLHPNGTAVVLQRAAEGSILAEASLFTPEYHCDAVAVTSATAHLVSKTAMQELFHTDRTFATAWASHLAGEIRNARLRSEILTLKTVAERLDAWIANHGELPGRGNWKSVALEIGTSPEALYREIARRKSA